MEKLVPKLRFPEFNGNWDKKKIGDIGDVKMCKRIFSEETTPNGEIPFYKIGSFGKVADAFISRELFENYKNRFSYPKIGDILISASGTIGRTVVYNGEEAYYQDSNIVWVGNNNTLVSNEFFYYILQLVKFNTEGGTIQRLYNSILKSTKFNCPKELIEQQKIASFLTSVDERLTLLAQQKEKLELYKKGVMQQIFSQKLRFKDENGNTYPDWEEKKLGEIGEVLNGLTYSPDDISTEGVLVLRSSNVKNRILKFDDNVYVANKSFNPVQENDILICVRNGSKNLIGKNALINKNASGMAFGAFMSIYRSKYNNFIFHWFDTTQYKKIVDMNLGATINSINGSDLKKFNIPFPCIEEQQKIASFLSAIDVQIEGVNKKIAQTKTFKKGLLQQLFV